MPAFNVSLPVVAVVDADTAEDAQKRLAAALTAAGFEVLGMPELHTSGGALAPFESDTPGEPLPGEPGSGTVFLTEYAYADLAGTAMNPWA